MLASVDKHWVLWSWWSQVLLGLLRDLIGVLLKDNCWSWPEDVPSVGNKLRCVCRSGSGIGPAVGFAGSHTFLSPIPLRQWSLRSCSY